MISAGSCTDLPSKFAHLVSTGSIIPGKGNAPEVEEFVRQYYAWTPLEDLTDRSPIDVYGAAVSHWSFARQRTPGSAKIRVYNPLFDEHGWQSTHTVVEIV